MRTETEIMEQLDARHAEIQAEGNSPARRWPCVRCRWRLGVHGQYCSNPLVAGFQGFVLNYEHVNDKFRKAKLCGPERVLWEPRLTLWQRIICFFVGE